MACDCQSPHAEVAERIQNWDMVGLGALKSRANLSRLVCKIPDDSSIANYEQMFYYRSIN